MLSAFAFAAFLSVGGTLGGVEKVDTGEAMNWAQVNIDGWQTTCDLQNHPEEMPTKCRAYYAFTDGGVSLEYDAKTVTVSVIGRCSNDNGRSQTYRLGEGKIDKLIAGVAARNIQNCAAPVLLPEMYKGLPGLNALLTYTVGPRS